jgi:hypothetical protein
MAMTKRQLALAVIRIDVAQHGELTRDGIRAYVENRVSAEARNEAMLQGMAIHEKAARSHTTAPDETTQLDCSRCKEAVRLTGRQLTEYEVMSRVVLCRKCDR